MDDQQRQDRIKKLHKLQSLHVHPYGDRVQEVTSAEAVHRLIDNAALEAGAVLPETQQRVAGRIVLIRMMGKLAFITLRDRSGDIQVGLSKNELADHWEVIKLLDLGDLIAACGRLGKTKTGEDTVWATQIAYLSKAIMPPPEKWHGLQDVDLRYRRRYVDLFANPPVQQVFQDRSKIVHAVRQTLVERRFLEVETPVLQPIYGGAAARPFTTHHNTLDMRLYLRISPELYLKRLLVGGMERVFEFSKNFRNEGISTKHNPEFTMLELYQAYGDYQDMMDITESIVSASIKALDGNEQRPFGAHSIDYRTPWKRATYTELLRSYAEIDIRNESAIREKADNLRLEHHAKDCMVVANEIFERTVEPNLIQPTFVLDYPAPLCPLTKRHPDDPSIALRFEAFVAGMELGNAYSELNDPFIQRENLSRQLAGEGEETMAVMDEDFLMSLEYGMPPAGGLGVGIDRLVMLLTNQTSIRDVILFPLQRPQQAQ